MKSKKKLLHYTHFSDEALLMDKESVSFLCFRSTKMDRGNESTVRRAPCLSVLFRHFENRPYLDLPTVRKFCQTLACFIDEKADITVHSWSFSRYIVYPPHFG